MKKSNTPSSGLVAVRVFVSGKKVKPHYRTVMKRVDEGKPSRPESTEGVTEGKHGLKSVEGYSYHAVLYVKEEDLDKLFLATEKKHTYAQREAEWLLANFGVDGFVEKDKIHKLRAKLKDVVYDEDRTKIHKQIARLQAKLKVKKEDPWNIERNAVSGLGQVLSQHADPYILAIVDAVHDSMPSFEGKTKAEILKLVERAVGTELRTNWLAAGRPFSFGLHEKYEAGKQESSGDKARRWDDIRLAVRRTLAWHILETLRAKHPDVYADIIPIKEHPFMGETEQRMATARLPSEALIGGAYGLSRQVAKGSIRFPIRRIQKGSYVKYEPDPSKMTKKQKELLPSLVSELMGARVALWDENGNMVVQPVVEDGPRAARMGMMDLIHLNARFWGKAYETPMNELQRLMSAGLAGMMEALYLYDPKKGQRSAEYEKDPAYAFMDFVADSVERNVATEAMNVHGELMGEVRQAQAKVKHKYAGSWGKAQICLHCVKAATYENLTRGIDREPTLEEILAVGVRYRYSIEKYIPQDALDGDDKAYEKWLTGVLTKGIEVEHYDLSAAESEDGYERNRTKVLSPGQLYSDAANWSRLENAGRPKTMGNEGTSDWRVRKLERDAHGNVVTGFRDKLTGKITHDPMGPSLVVDEYARDAHGKVLLDENREPKLRPPNEVYRTYRGGMAISIHQVEKYEALAKVRDELFSAMNELKELQRYKFTADDARLLDLMCFRGLALDPNQQYYGARHALRALERTIAQLKGKIKSHNMVVTDMSATIIEQGGPDVSRRLQEYKKHASETRKRFHKELDQASDKYKRMSEKILYPMAMAPSQATPGMLHYPGIPVDSETGALRKDLVSHLDHEFTKYLGKITRYDAALHMALKMRLEEPVYNIGTKSIHSPEDIDNPDLRRMAKIWFDSGKLPEFVESSTQPGIKLLARDEFTVTRGKLQRKKSKFKTGVPEGTKRPTPMVFDGSLDFGKGDWVPLYSIVDDIDVSEHLAEAQRLENLIKIRGYLDPKHPNALPTVKDLYHLSQGDTPTVTMAADKTVRGWLPAKIPGRSKGPPVGSSISTVEEVGIDPETGIAEYAAHKPRVYSADLKEFKKWRKKQDVAFTQRKVEAEYGTNLEATRAVLEKQSKAKMKNGRDPVKENLRMLEGISSNAHFAKEYSKFLSDLGLTVNAMWDTRDVLYREKALARTRFGFDPVVAAQQAGGASRADVYSAATRPTQDAYPLPVWLSSAQTLAVMKSLLDSGVGQKIMLESKRTKRRNVIVFVNKTNAFERDEKGKVKLYATGENKGQPILKPGIKEMERPKIGRKTRGHTFGKYKGGDIYMQYYRVEKRVLPTSKAKIGEQASERYNLLPPSAIPVESSVTNMEMYAWTKDVANSDPSKHWGVFPPSTATIDSNTGSVELTRPTGSVDDIQPAKAPKFDKELAQAWANIVRQSAQPVSPRHGGKAPITKEGAPVRSAPPQSVTKLREAIKAEIQAHKEIRAKGKTVSPARLQKLRNLLKEYKKVRPELKRNKLQRKAFVEAPPRKSGNPKFAFSNIVRVFTSREVTNV